MPGKYTLDVLQVLGTRVAALAISLGGSVILARALGPEGRGEFVFALTVAALIAQVGNIGLLSSNTYLAARDTGLVGPLTVNDVLYSNLPFDPVKDFVVISLTAQTPLVLGLGMDVPAKTLKEFVDHAKSKRPPINYASPGVGVPPHFASEMFRARAGFASTPVPYRSGAAVIEALMKNEVQWAFDVPVTMTAQHKAGKLRAIATAANRRWTGLEEVPTFAESGYQDMEIMGWFALCGPAGLPQDMVQRLNVETAKALATPEAKQRLANLGFAQTPTTPAEARAFVAAERKRWVAVAKANNIKVE